MKIIVGLGNPGPKYELTKHNVGFLSVDRLIDTFNATGPTKKFKAEIYEAQISNEKTYLVKPQTFMNLSGEAVGPLFGFYKCKPGDLIVIYDELDLPPFSLKIKQGGGTAGHNGLKSLDQHLGAGNKGYTKVRIGIGKPQVGSGRDHVLHPFSDEELKELDPLLDDVVKASELLVQGKVTEAMNQYNQKRKKEPEEESK